MPEIRSGRWTARYDAPFVVFLIGMRFNKLWKVHRWAPVMMAMPRMLDELRRQPELGLLGVDAWLGRTLLMVQYWRSFHETFEVAAGGHENVYANMPAILFGKVGALVEARGPFEGASTRLNPKTPAETAEP